jgi:hypothetical protein
MDGRIISRFAGMTGNEAFFWFALPFHASTVVQGPQAPRTAESRLALMYFQPVTRQDSIAKEW